MKFPYCSRCRDQVVWYAVLVNVLQVIFKGSMALLSGSAALLADAFHSSADVIASGVTVLSLRISKAPADEDHAYGHGKIQFISSATVGLILAAGASALLVTSLSSVMKGEYEAPSRLAVLGAIISIISNEIMFRYQGCVGRELNSPAIMANAWDNRSDAISSIGVLVGLLFATFGYPIADPLASMALALIVFRIGFELIVEAIQGLMDAMPDREDLEEIYRIAKKSPGVLGIAYLRARIMGEELHVDLHVQVDGKLKVYEGDLIVDVLKDKLHRGLNDKKSTITVYLTPLGVG
ncbi:MAG: magnetosome biogenesis CDF transporter MamB [Magnetococcales bacterium]|nr:magnetosome biogenesis CDF transporter MamB [Magnetococcales bacterium]MBF0583810.1 magnetosome biogenesis CDF transporter MamB [Magnetococcales bacterium]